MRHILIRYWFYQNTRTYSDLKAEQAQQTSQSQKKCNFGVEENFKGKVDKTNGHLRLYASEFLSGIKPYLKNILAKYDHIWTVCYCVIAFYNNVRVSNLKHF